MHKSGVGNVYCLTSRLFFRNVVSYLSHEVANVVTFCLPPRTHKRRTEHADKAWMETTVNFTDLRNQIVRNEERYNI
jgi:hypothetical protein